MLQLPIFCLVNLSCQSLKKLYYYYNHDDNNNINNIIVNLSCQRLKKLLLSEEIILHEGVEFKSPRLKNLKLSVC